MRRAKSKVPTFGENVGTFGKLTMAWAAGRRPMADCVSAKIIMPARGFVNPIFAVYCIGGRHDPR
jgi:hypothetical protein